MAGVLRSGATNSTTLQPLGNYTNTGGFEYTGSPTDYVDNSSTGTSKWTPAVWSGTMVEKFYEATVCADIANTDYEGDISGMGDTVYIRTTPDIVITPYTIGQKLTYQLPESANTTLVIDQALSFSFAIDNIDKFQSDLDLLSDWTEDAGRQMAIAVDTDCLSYATANAGQSGATAGAISGDINLGVTVTPRTLTAANVIDWIVDLSIVLDEDNVPDDFRYLVVPAKVLGLIKRSDLKDASLAGDATSISRNGLVGMIDRFTLFHSNLLPAGVAGGLAAGETSVLFGHRSGMTFAGQIQDDKLVHMLNPESHGELIRGLTVYGREVIKPESVGHSVVTI